MTKHFELNILALDGGMGTACILVAPSGRIVWYLMTRMCLLQHDDADPLSDQLADVHFSAATVTEAAARALGILRSMGWDGRPWKKEDTVAYGLFDHADGPDRHIILSQLVKIAGNLHDLPVTKAPMARCLFDQVSYIISSACLSAKAKARLVRMAELLFFIPAGLSPDGNVNLDGFGKGRIDGMESKETKMSTERPFKRLNRQTALVERVPLADCAMGAFLETADSGAAQTLA